MESKLEVTIDGVLATATQIESWERGRAQAVLLKLRRILKVEAPTGRDSNDIASQRDELLRLKELASGDGLRDALSGSIRMSSRLTKLIVRLSGSHRKQCVVKVSVSGCSAQQIAEGIDDMMCADTAANRRSNLLACPDHYVLEPRGMVLEVIETTGGSPLPARFFLRFGDESGLKSQRDASYPYQSAGTARLVDGTVVGGVRHQFRDERGGAQVRLMVEFPKLTPERMIRQHQWHLACEFSHWLGEIQHRVETSACPPGR